MKTWSSLVLLLAVGAHDVLPTRINSSQLAGASANHVLKYSGVNHQTTSSSEWYRGLEDITSPPTSDVLSTNPPTTVEPSPHPSPPPIPITLAPTPTTEQPTPSPTTKAPSPSPTFEPSKKPTAIPTNQPTPQPSTKSPSDAPSKQPTPLPTDQPSKKPTKIPTQLPSEEPVASPTAKPTDKPTKVPTRFPSLPPTNIPTKKPSRKPSQQPSKNPTPLPSNQPTKKPSPAPSGNPTRNPTPNPSNNPTSKPTTKPSNKPSNNIPTRVPSKQPSPQPSEKPTDKPTLVPTSSPSNDPTLKPSARPSRSPTITPTQSPTTSKPTKVPSHSPTLSALPSKSLDDCLSDSFGIERVYSPGNNSGLDWYSSWDEEREISGYNADPFVIDTFDVQTTVKGNGAVSISDGIATLQRSPQIQIMASNNGLGNTEMTGYGRYLSGGTERGYSGFNMVVRLTHPSDDWRCGRPSYRAQVSLSGIASFQKEYRPKNEYGTLIRSSRIRTAIPAFDGVLPRDEWIGMKFIVRNVNQDQVLELYLDLNGGEDGTNQNWTLVHSYSDSAGSWLANDALPQDNCSASLQDGDVFLGKSVYGELNNVGDIETQVQWKDVSLRSISSDTTMRVACTSVAPTLSPSLTPTKSPSVIQTALPSSDELSLPPSLASIQTDESTSLFGVLKFKLPMDTLLEESDVTAFEGIVEEFLGKRMSSRGDPAGSNTTIYFEDYEAQVISQALITEDTATTSNDTDTEPVRKLVEETFLIIDTTVTANANPADIAAEYPFQTVLYKVLARNSEVFYDKLFSSPDFMPEQSLESVDIESGDKKSLALGTSIAGILILLALVAAFFIMRRRHESQNAEGDEEAPPVVCTAVEPHYDEEDGEMSSMDDSFLPDKLRLITSHIENAKNATDLDLWSLADDAYPVADALQKEVNVASKGPYLMPHSEMTDSDESANASPKQDINVPLVDEENPTTESEDIVNDLQQLSNEMQFIDTIVEEPSSPPKPARGGIKLFSCFADNTFEEQALSTPQIIGQDFKSNATSKSSPAAGPQASSSNVYEVIAPPGPLGILIDTSNDGPFIFEVKEGSPLLNLVEKGDIILSVDGVDMDGKDAAAVAKHIATKPKKDEQTLKLKSIKANDDEMSI